MELVLAEDTVALFRPTRRGLRKVRGRWNQDWMCNLVDDGADAKQVERGRMASRPNFLCLRCGCDPVVSHYIGFEKHKCCLLVVCTEPRSLFDGVLTHAAARRTFRHTSVSTYFVLDRCTLAI